MNSLVKFDDPVLLGEGKERRKAKPKPATGTAAKLSGFTESPKDSMGQTREVLNSIIPPKEAKHDTQTWVQYVSLNPATRNDVIILQKELDKQLQERRARETGICPVRQELYAQCFDELIRQVTINCQERGLLLTRVRDEIRMSVQAYQKLYESSIAFGMRKALESEQGKTDLEAKIEALEAEKQDLERQVSELKTKCEFIEKRDNERRAHDEKKHAEEVSFLKRTNMQLKTQLESILKRN